MPSRQTKDQPSPAEIVLALMREGQALNTVTRFGKTEASIGGQAIPPEIVDRLKAQGLIRCPRFDDFGSQHGKHCRYELTEAGAARADEPAII